MANVQWYNSDVKKEFLSVYPEGTANSYKRIFDHSVNMENILEKDLADFDIPQIRNFLSDLEPGTIESSRTSGRSVSAYLNWAIEKGIRKESKGNPLLTVPKEWFDDFVVVEPYKLYLTDRDIERIEDGCANAQDAVIIRLLWEGCNGKEISEISNLRKTDVNKKTNKLNLCDEDGNRRELGVSEKCIEYITDAISQKFYKKKNDEADLPANILPFNELARSNYVVRNSLTNTERENSPVNKYTIYRRVDMVRKYFGYEHLNVKNIQRSGMIYFAKELLLARGKSSLEKAEYIEIAKRFKVNNFYRMKEYVNDEIIERLYGKPDIAGGTYNGLESEKQG